MADRTVTVTLRASVADYTAKMNAAARVTQELANKVDVAKSRAAQGYATIGRGMILTGGMVVAGFGAAIKAAADFDQRMALVQTLSKSTAGQMSQLRDAALHVGQAYGYSANQVADAEAELVKAGVSVSDILGGALVGALTLAAAGQTNVAQATEIAATAMTQFGLTGRDIPHVADLLAAGADKALGSVGDLGYALDQAGPSAHLFGVSLEETVGTLAAFAQAGQIGERGGTEFNQMLIQLANPSHEAATLMQQLGIEAFDAGGKFVGMANFAGELQDKLGPLTQAQRTNAEAVIFGSRAIKAANILYVEGQAGIEAWTKKVNDAGFAELQAAGKLNSLTGDWQKFEAAVTEALIGAGEGSQGVLRTMVQDATGAVSAWNNLPTPIKAVTKDIVLLGGAVTLTGGLVLVSISKWKAFNVALEDAGVGAISARSALMGIGKAGLVTGVVVGIAYGFDKLANSVGRAAPTLDAAENSLIRLGRTGQVSGALLEVYGKNLEDLKLRLQQISAPSYADQVEKSFDPGRLFGHPLNTIDLDTRDLDAFDKALADLVTSGRPDLARRAFDKLTASEVAQGGKAAWLADHLHLYAKAVDTSKTVAEIAAGAQRNFAFEMHHAATQTGQATAAAKAYNDTLHAMYDPIFAFSQALDNAKDKQHAYTKAVKQFGADSKQARQALVDVATSTLDVTTNANALAAALKDNPALMKKFIDQLDQWKAHGQATGAEVDGLTSIVKGLLVQAGRLNGSDYHFKVTADTTQVHNAFSWLFSALNNIPSTKTVTIVGQKRTVPVTSPTHHKRPEVHAYGGWVGGYGGPRQDNQLIMASTGEYVVNAYDAARNGALLEAINSGAKIDPVVAHSVRHVHEGPPSKSFNVGDVHVHYPEPEKASEAVPRALRTMAFLHGGGWTA